MKTIFHALVVNLHQPAGNLEALLDGKEWEARQIAYTLDRIPRSLWPYEDITRVQLSLSGTLLEALSNPECQRRVYGIVKCGNLVWHLQNEKIFQILGRAYDHPVLPLIPAEVWNEQVIRWQGIGRHLFWRTQFSGFWPPEMGFCMELIPLLSQLGYRYVLVDSNHVEPLGLMRWEEIRYRPHVARFNGHQIMVVVRDRDLSDAQLAGMAPDWFMREVNERTKFCDFPPLVTTCSGGDNGGWFRNTSAKGSFWDEFYQPLLEQISGNATEISPVFIDDYLDHYGAPWRGMCANGRMEHRLARRHGFRPMRRKKCSNKSRRSVTLFMVTSARATAGKILRNQLFRDCSVRKQVAISFGATRGSTVSIAI